jgi:hypothetical protein
MLQVSRQSVHELITRNVIERGADGLVDVDMAKLAIANRVRPSGKTSATIQPPATTTPILATAPPAATDDGNATSYHVAKTLREVAEARLAQLRLGEMRGDLVRVDEVRASLARRASAFREGLLQIPARLSAVLAAETDQARVHALLDGELRTVMLQLTEVA